MTNSDVPNGTDWQIYQGTGKPHYGLDELPEPPPWRRFDGGPVVLQPPGFDETGTARRLGAVQRAQTYRATSHVVDAVNAALYLRRPLLVTGKPGTGKSTLAYSVAYELQMGPVLSWAITSRSTLVEGLYSYDPIGRLHDAGLTRQHDEAPDIGRYVRLGPLGTALLPWHRPRVLLVDEMDKSDIDLPNDLLHVFEEGGFVLPELARAPEPEHSVMTADGHASVALQRGEVTCRAFPLVVITSNGERMFPPAFLRRCIQVKLDPPGPEQLAEIVMAHLGPEALDQSSELIHRFLDRRSHGDLATDQLLNAVFLASSGGRVAGRSEETLARLESLLLQALGETP